MHHFGPGAWDRYSPKGSDAKERATVGEPDRDGRISTTEGSISRTTSAVNGSAPRSLPGRFALRLVKECELDCAGSDCGSYDSLKPSCVVLWASVRGCAM